MNQFLGILTKYPYKFKCGSRVAKTISMHVGKFSVTHIPNYKEPTGQQASKQIPKTPYPKQRPSILKRNFKIKIGNILRIGERTPKYWTDSQKNNGGRSLRGSGMKAKLCKNHICVISKEDTGRDCGKNAACSSEGQFWVSIEIMRQMVEINKG